MDNVRHLPTATPSPRPVGTIVDLRDLDGLPVQVAARDDNPDEVTVHVGRAYARIDLADLTGYMTARALRDALTLVLAAAPTPKGMSRG